MPVVDVGQLRPRLIGLPLFQGPVRIPGRGHDGIRAERSPAGQVRFRIVVVRCIRVAEDESDGTELRHDGEAIGQGVDRPVIALVPPDSLVVLQADDHQAVRGIDTVARPEQPGVARMNDVEDALDEENPQSRLPDLTDQFRHLIERAYALLCAEEWYVFGVDGHTELVRKY